ncbi:DUF2877 domain-containing protein [Cytobacillus praedii]|uniref:DUF2877 domain-containing protein n=1 Tax=Cytobacillus praedii TaxID=1742358 RepID=UPI002E1D2133|nr:DUF2877 domain-containing protein [Cytobacillus praedii]
MLKTQTMYAEEYERNIPLFLIENPIGSVHSLFQNGLNIRMGGRLFFIGTDKNGKLPFGIHLQKDAIQRLLSSIQAPAAVHWDNDSKELIFEDSNIRVNFQKGTPFSNIVPFTKNDRSTQYLETFIKALAIEGEQTGLDLDIEQFLLEYLRMQKEKYSASANEVYRLMDALSSHDSSEVDRVLRYFLGRGRGLTPSGDDHLVGLLAIHTISGICSPLFLQTIQDILLNESVTTDIGREYLLYALKGEFSSTIVNILNCLAEKDRQEEAEKHVLHLLTVGHSSGIDTAFGLLIGLLTMKNWRK